MPSCNSFHTAAAVPPQDVIAGQLDIMFDQAATSGAACARRHVAGVRGHGQQALAGRARYSDVDEAGLPGLYISIWHAVGAEGLPKPIVDDIAYREAQPTNSAQAADRDRSEIPALEQQSLILRAHHKMKLEKCAASVKTMGIKPEAERRLGSLNKETQREHFLGLAGCARRRRATRRLSSRQIT